jgi:hypothetical protein
MKTKVMSLYLKALKQNPTAQMIKDAIKEAGE